MVWKRVLVDDVLFFADDKVMRKHKKRNQLHYSCPLEKLAKMGTVMRKRGR